MATGWRHPVADAGPHGAGWRIHPWMGREYRWTRTCVACYQHPGHVLVRTPHGHGLMRCPVCHGTTWRLVEVGA